MQAKLTWEPSIDNPQVQQWYRQNEKCALWTIFEGINDWVIVDCSKPTNKRRLDTVHDSLIKDSHRVILEKEAVRTTSKRIVRDNIGAITTDDPAADGYYLVQWSGQPYQTEQAATTLPDTNPPTIVARTAKGSESRSTCLEQHRMYSPRKSNRHWRNGRKVSRHLT
jgi:hypothetical protein